MKVRGRIKKHRNKYFSNEELLQLTPKKNEKKIKLKYEVNIC